MVLVVRAMLFQFCLGVFSPLDTGTERDFEPWPCGEAVIDIDDSDFSAWCLYAPAVG